MKRTSPPFRAEHIGSLLRPTTLLAARSAHAQARIGDDALAAIEQDAIRRVVKLQEDAGLELVTDGEFRRSTYSDSFTTSGISGVAVELT
jgi:5-methyltetrahydropteroyltriglutamate--homocysteine methyltransferase